ncbi:MAG TPA: biotin/lipoyl-binding protein [Planctomycetota bacterium]|nr:biotin/lipoyl-binding protein [Planctomycetota bacterium]
MGKIAIVLAVLAVIALLYFGQERHAPLTVSGFIEADEIRLGSRVGGRVASVAAREGLPVRKGDVLVELEPFDILEARTRAEAGVAASRAERDKLAAGFRPQEIAQARARRGQIAARLAKLVSGPRKQEIATARALLSLAEAELELTELEHRRTSDLFKDQVKSQEELDRSSAERKAAQSRVQARKLPIEMRLRHDHPRRERGALQEAGGLTTQARAQAYNDRRRGLARMRSSRSRTARSRMGSAPAA